MNPAEPRKKTIAVRATAASHHGRDGGRPLGKRKIANIKSSSPTPADCGSAMPTSAAYFLAVPSPRMTTAETPTSQPTAFRGRRNAR